MFNEIFIWINKKIKEEIFLYARRDSINDFQNNIKEAFNSFDNCFSFIIIIFLIISF